MKKKIAPMAVWQQNPDQLETDFVQYWRGGIMITGQMPLARAQQLVRDGVAFVICGQAIGCLIDGRREA